MAYQLPNPSGSRDGAMPRCSRTRYVALALLAGPLGLHNFAAGYRARGVIQLGLSVASAGLLSPLTAIWAMIECVATTRDADGVPFSPRRALDRTLTPEPGASVVRASGADSRAAHRQAA